MIYVPLKRGQWPKDREAGRAEFRRRFPEFVAAVERVRAWAGGGVSVVGAVNVHGDEWGEVTDQMRRDVHRVETETPAPKPAQPYRGKKR